VWEVKNVPVEEDPVDLYVKVTFNPTGWSDDEVVKSTDTHMHS
jgi:hypothetical protein